VNNIKMNLTETGCGGRYWVDLAQKKDQIIMNLWVPQNV
jgi:hypothetical protein